MHHLQSGKKAKLIPRAISNSARYKKAQQPQGLLCFLVFAFLGLIGCSHVPEQPPYSHTLTSTATVEQCRELYAYYDRSTDRLNINHAAVSRIDGYPFFRSNRFLASFESDLLQGDVEQWRVWLRRLNQLAIEALVIEWQQLPDGFRYKAATTPSRLSDTLQRCGTLLVEEVLKDPSLWSDLMDRARVSDHYSTFKRTIGLYPLVKPFFNAGVAREISSLQEQRRLFRDAKTEFIAYRVQTAMQAPITVIEQDALGIPLLDAQEVQRWLSRWRPHWRVEQQGEYDQPGRLRWSSQGYPEVDRQWPTLYEHVSYGRWQGKVTLQLNYSLWFSERPPAGPFDMLAGALDGLIWRVHLDLHGKPLAFDSVHTCGCWYQLYPATGFQAKGVRDGSESVLVDSALATAGQQHEQRVIELSVRSADHQIIRAEWRTLNVMPDASGFFTTSSAFGSTSGSLQRLYPEKFSQLYRLAFSGSPEVSGDQRTRSLFDHQGLIPSSQRAERWIFWPMGIASAGAMRMPGTHAIAFVGRRHFDDADILYRAGLTSLD